ncbi:DsbA family oxidoreductase [soil metagenome]|nr:DsbA family protein [Gemmatimonadota bacterium]
MNPERVLVFADFTCPFSYITETGLRRVVSASGRDIEYRAYEICPTPAPLPAPEETAGGWEDALRPLAEEVGVRLRHPSFLPRTRKAHEAARFARERGLEHVLREGIFAALWQEGLDIGRIDVLTRVAAGVGIDPAELKVELDIDRFADEVIGDRSLAERLGVQHTPTLVVGSGDDQRVWVGAQGYADLRALLSNGD